MENDVYSVICISEYSDTVIDLWRQFLFEKLYDKTKLILSVGDLFFRSILTPLHFLNKWFSKKILEKFLKKPPFTVLDFL